MKTITLAAFLSMASCQEVQIMNMEKVKILDYTWLSNGNQVEITTTV